MWCVQDRPSLVGLREELGVEGGRYDFAAQDIQKKQAAYQKAMTAKDEKESSVNKQARPPLHRLLPIHCTAFKSNVPFSATYAASPH